jgi:8-oxo-dGTP diphosphatase
MPAENPIQTVIVVAALITRGNEVLIAQRPPGTALAGAWEFPGGKVEPGEDPRDALVRECREELDITVRVGRIYETIYTQSGERGILLLFYITEIVDGEPRSMEDNAFAWATPSAMREYDLLPADRPLIDQLEERFPVQS